MKFDWSMVKGVRTGSARQQSVHVPSAAPERRFPRVGDQMPIAADVGAPLIDFITWCVPDDGTELPEPIGRLYVALEAGEEPNTVTPGHSPR